MKKKGLIITSIIAAGLAVIVLMTYWSLNNSEVKLRNLAEGQEQVCKNNFDAMYKTIKQIANVTEEHKNAFKDIYLGMTSGRYENDKQVLMKWVRESNPNFKTGMYERLADVIESKRDGFKHEQDKLADIQREWKDLTMTLPGSIFVGGRPALAITFVSSANTKEVYRTGEENDLELFDKKN